MREAAAVAAAGGEGEAHADEEQQEEEEGEFFTEGTDALKQARLFIARYSLPRAAERVYWQRMLHSLSVRRAEKAVAATVQKPSTQQNAVAVDGDAMSDEPTTS
jgi:hypothetical protein